MNNKTLLLFTVSYPFGSSEDFIHNEIEYLSKNFRQVRIIPKNYYKNKKARILPPNVTFIKPVLFSNPVLRFLQGIFNCSPILYFFKELLEQKAYNHPVRFFWWLAQSTDIRAFLAHARLKKEIHQENSILYFYWGRGLCNILSFYKNILSPKIVRFHRVDLYEQSNPLFYREQLLSSIDYALPISSDGADYLKTRYPQYKDKVQLHRLGSFDKGQGLPSKDGVFRIVSCSYMIPRKRVDIIAQTLLRIDRPVEWIHFGDGTEMKKILDIVKKLPSNIKAVLKGQVSNVEILSYYRANAFDLFINISTSEGIPVSIMEAMSFGIPALATDVGGTSELVNDSTGFLVKAETNEKELSEILKTIMEKDLQPYRDNSRRRWSEMYNADLNYKRFAEFLNTL